MGRRRRGTYFHNDVKTATLVICPRPVSSQGIRSASATGYRNRLITTFISKDIIGVGGFRPGAFGDDAFAFEYFLQENSFVVGTIVADGIIDVDRRCGGATFRDNPDSFGAAVERVANVQCRQFIKIGVKYRYTVIFTTHVKQTRSFAVSNTSGTPPARKTVCRVGKARAGIRDCQQVITSRIILDDLWTGRLSSGILTLHDIKVPSCIPRDAHAVVISYASTCIRFMQRKKHRSTIQRWRQ